MTGIVAVRKCGIEIFFQKGRGIQFLKGKGVGRILQSEQLVHIPDQMFQCPSPVIDQGEGTFDILCRQRLSGSKIIHGTADGSEGSPQIMGEVGQHFRTFLLQVLQGAIAGI